jgi:hypothetical protein
MAAIAASKKSRTLNAGRTSSGASKRIIKNAGAAISTLNSASMQNDSREAAFLFVHLALEAIIPFPWHNGISTEPAPLTHLSPSTLPICSDAGT